MFRPVSSRPRLRVGGDATCSTRWARTAVFERSVEQRAGAPPWIFYEGPPTANNKPGAAPRVGARLQGPVLPLPDDARPPRRAKRRVGHPRAARRGRGREAPRHLGEARDRGEDRHRAVRRAVPRVRRGLRRGVREADEADRLLGRLRRRLPDLRPRVRRLGVVAPEDDLRQGPAVRGPEGPAVLPALRDAAVQPRARPARRLHRRGRPARLRALRARRGRRRAARGRDVAHGLDDHAVDAARATSGVAVQSRSSPTRSVDGTIVADDARRDGLRRGRGRRGTVPGERARGPALPAPVHDVEVARGRRAASSCPPTT